MPNPSPALGNAKTSHDSYAARSARSSSEPRNFTRSATPRSAAILLCRSKSLPLPTTRYSKSGTRACTVDSALMTVSIPLYCSRASRRQTERTRTRFLAGLASVNRSEEHTSELQSHLNLVCRLLLEKKKTQPHADHDQHNRTAAPRPCEPR